MNRLKCLLFLPAMAVPALAGPLTGTSGVFNLPAASGTLADMPGVLPTTASLGPNHSGTWANPAPAPWHGTYTAVGPVPASANSCSCVFDFSALSAGFLPAGTYIRLSDLDSLEQMGLTGYDTSGNPLLSHWLTDLVFVAGNNPAEFIQAFMPSWTFNPLTGNYTLTGEASGGNPTSFYVLQTTQDMLGLQLNKGVSYGLALAAPVPEPGTLALTALAFAAAGLLRRRHRL